MTIYFSKILFVRIFWKALFDSSDEYILPVCIPILFAIPPPHEGKKRGKWLTSSH